jgi:hypothetical protein
MFKFTIREAILMTTIVAVLLMWWMERNHNAMNDARLTAIETRLQAVFPGGIVAVFPATPPPPMIAPVGPTIPAAPAKPQAASSDNVVIAADAQPIIKRSTIYPTTPGLPPEARLIPRVEDLQKSIPQQVVPRLVMSPAPQPKGISATVHSSTDTPYRQLDSVLKAMRRAGVEDITIASH